MAGLNPKTENLFKGAVNSSDFSENPFLVGFSNYGRIERDVLSFNRPRKLL